MSTRTAPFMTQRGGGGPSSPWQRPSGMGASNNRQESRPNNSRGYAIPSSNNKSHRPNFAPPPARQDWGDHSSPSYNRSDADWNRNRDRDRDQHYDRRNSNDYRPNGFERGHRPPARYNNDDIDRDRNTNRGRGYENNSNRPPSFDIRRPMVEGNAQRDERGGNYNEPREFSRYNSSANDNRRQGMGGGSNYYDNDDGRSIGRNGNGGVGNRYQDSRDSPRESERRGNFGREQHNRESLDYQRREHQRSHNETNDFREFRHPNDNNYPPSRFPSDRNPDFYRGSGRRDDYIDRGEGHDYQRSRQPEQRWQGPPPAESRGKESYNNNERSDFSNHRTGTGERSWERSEPRAREWSTKRPEEATRGYSMDAKSRTEWSRNKNHDNLGWGETNRGKLQTQEFRETGHVKLTSHPSEEKANSAVTSTRREDVPPYSSPLGNDRYNNNTRKREREDDNNTQKTTAMASKTGMSVNATLGNFSASTAETNSKQESAETKKIKLSSATSTTTTIAIDSANKCTSNSNSVNKGIELALQEKKMDSKTVAPSTSPSAIPVPSSQTKIHDKPNTKSIPVKAASSSIKKLQIQAKPKSKTKLGIPMRWLKPKAKPKPPVKKVLPKPPEDTSKSTKIPLKLQPAPIKKLTSRPSSPSNLLVTDSSEASSSLSNRAKKQKSSSVPAAIVTKKKTKKAPTPKTKNKTEFEPEEEPEDEWDSEAAAEESDGDDSDSDSDTDDNEVLDWASKMLGVPTSPSSIQPTESNDSIEPNTGKGDETTKVKSPKLKIRLSAALKLKLTESTQSNNDSGGNGLSKEDGNKLEAALKKLERKKKKREKLKALSEKINDERPEFDQEKAKMEIEEERRKREEAKPLTAKELRKILRDDTFSDGGNQNNWVRRSRRQPNKNLLNSKAVRILVDKLKYNDIDMRVLKMKKFINDPNTPCAVIDAILNAMEENTNCEALYIQNFNEGMRDEQVLHLLRILQQPCCNIWCLNIGENYNVSDATWGKFTKGLMHTKITHMYASEHTITSDMKEEIRFTIRENRNKHDMHINPNNLDVIIQCTHCWWNPINAKVLRPYLKKKGYEHVLKDKEGQGLQGSKSMAPTS